MGAGDNSKTEVVRGVFLIRNTSSRYGLTMKFHEYIPYGLGVMSLTQIFSITLHGP